MTLHSYKNQSIQKSIIRKSRDNRPSFWRKNHPSKIIKSRNRGTLIRIISTSNILKELQDYETFCSAISTDLFLENNRYGNMPQYFCWHQLEYLDHDEILSQQDEATYHTTEETIAHLQKRSISRRLEIARPVTSCDSTPCNLVSC